MSSIQISMLLYSLEQRIASARLLTGVLSKLNVALENPLQTLEANDSERRSMLCLLLA